MAAKGRGASTTADERSPTARAFAEAAEEDLGFQVRSWRVQRAGWAVGLLLLAAALAGVAGNGPLSNSEVRSEDGNLTVGYDRFARHGAPAQVHVRVAPGLVGQGLVVLWLGREWLDGVQLEQVVPEPSRVVEGEGRTGFEFEAGDVGSEGLDVTFRVEYDEPFLRRGNVAVGDTSQVEFRQFVYP